MRGKNILPVAVLTGALVAGCASGESTSSAIAPSSHSAAAAPGELTSVKLLGRDKDGGEDAVNYGSKVDVYNPATLRTIGGIARNEVFIINCVGGPKPASLEVTIVGSVRGDVELGGSALDQFIEGPAAAAVPTC